MVRRTSQDRSFRSRWAGVLVASLLVAGCGESGSSPTTGDGAATAADVTAIESEGTWTEGATADGNWSIAWRPEGGVIPPLDPFAVEVVVRDSAGGVVPDAVTVLVDATMPHHGHGMNVEPRIERLAEEAPGGGTRFRAEGMLLHMPGRWEFTVDVVRGGDVERAQWTVMLDD